METKNLSEMILITFPFIFLNFRMKDGKVEYGILWRKFHPDQIKGVVKAMVFGILGIIHICF